MEDKVFEKGTRLNVQFNTHKGLLPIQDMWQLPLTKLDEIAVKLDEGLQKGGKKSFRKNPKSSAEDSLNQLKLDIILKIIEIRELEAEEQKEANTRAEKKAVLKALIDKKKTESLEGKSLEELEAELAKL